MALTSSIAALLDRCLSPELRKLDPGELSRARFLVFSILFTIPCHLFPWIVPHVRGGAYSIWIHASLLNIAWQSGLIWHLRSAPAYLPAARLFLIWMHALLLIALLVVPAVFSLACIWSPCLIVVSSLIFGLRGVALSSLVLTSASIGNVLWRHAHGSSWIGMDFDPFAEQILLHLLGSSLFMAIVTGVYEFLREASSNKETRQRLLAARHAHTGAVGELVGHVAHEVNNPLAILQGSASRLRRQLERNEWRHEARKLLSNMQRSHERIIRVQQSLAVFSGGNPDEPFVTHDIRSILRDVQLAMNPQAQVQQVRLDFADRSAHSSLRCQPHQLVYVLSSLIQNALDACRGREGPRIQVVVEYEAGRLSIAITDNGRGIDEADQDRVFQPFFTTKVGGSAQGLSLSVSRGILVEHGGEILFQSRPGATTFICHFPRDAMASIKTRKGA